MTHTSYPSEAAPSLSFELLLAIWQRHSPPHTNTHLILSPRAAAPKTRVGGGASTTTTVFGLLEPQQDLGSRRSTEARQSSRPWTASTEHDMGQRPFWYAIGSDQRTKPKKQWSQNPGTWALRVLEEEGIIPAHKKANAQMVSKS